MGVQLRGVEYKEAATLGKIYHRLQQYGPGKEAETKSWIIKQQVSLMIKINKGEDLDGNMARLAGQLTSLYKKAEVMAHVFWERYPQPPQFKVIGTEVKHSMDWNGLILGGTIDKLLVNNVDDFVWIRDHKSTGRSLAFVFGGLAWSIQARIYRILAENYLGSAPRKGVRGFILDGIIRPGIKLCKTDEKNAKEWGCPVEDAYLRRVEEWYKEYEVKAELEGKKNAKAIGSKAILFTEPLMPDELSSVLNKIREISTRLFLPEVYNRDVTRSACFAYERQCIYHDLCETDPKQWDSLFETKYQLKPAEADEDVEEDTL